MLFDTENILQLIGIIVPEGTIVTIGEPGGNVDTKQIQVKLPDCTDTILISGFKTNGYYGEQRDKVDAEMLHICDTSADSRGGIQTHHVPTAVAAAEITTHLRHHGWDITGRLKDYF